ncbi:MAG: hypothetical protein U0V72_06750 [Cytophagales bacterium]
MQQETPKFSFGIINSEQFLEKLLSEYEDFDKNPISARHAINCALTAWHLTDWIYQEHSIIKDNFKDSEKTKEKNGITERIKISGLKKFQDHLINQKCKELSYMRDISNGSKHCLLRNTEIKGKTLKYIGNYSFKDYSRKDYNVDRFIYEDGNGVKQNFEDALLTVIEFWKNFILQPELLIN